MYERNSVRPETFEYTGTRFIPGQKNARLTQNQLDLDDLKVENAYFKSFDIIVRRQLDPVWHKVGPRTKQLVGDLSTLRRLLL